MPRCPLPTPGRVATGKAAAALAGLSVAIGLVAGASPAQEAGGVWLRLGLSQRAETLSNADLLPSGDGEGRTLRTDTGIEASISSITRTDRLVLSFGASLSYVEAPREQDDIRFDIQSPSASLSYVHAVGDRRLSARISVDESDLTYLRSQTVIFLPSDETGIEEDTGSSPVIDIENVYDTGTRRQSRANLGARFGIGSPVELGVSASARRLRYIDAGPSYEDSDTNNLRTTLSLRIAPALTFDGSLGVSRFNEEGSEARDTWSVSTALSRQGERGRLSASLNLAKVEEGTRSTVGIGWQLPLPNGRLAANLGFTRAASGSSGPTGGLSWAQEIMPDINARAGLNHGFAANNDDRETRFTNASAAVSAPLGRLTALNLGLDWVQNDVSGGGDETRQGSLSLGISHELGQDWSLSTGYRRIHRRENDLDWAQSDNLYISVGRNFAVRF